jgi:hypothetical protein
MNNVTKSSVERPAEVRVTQILIYLTAVVNIFNGIYSIGGGGTVKTILAVCMIIFGVAAIWIGGRLKSPGESPWKMAFSFAVILIVLRIIEFLVWRNNGFLIGIILPILVIWRLNSPEARAWFGVVKGNR